MGTLQATQVTVFSQKTVEYYTPAKYIEVARRVMGGIHLDPASCDFAQEWIKATHYFTKDGPIDALTYPWQGRVWLNPPYGSVGGKSMAGTWAAKLEHEVSEGRVTVGILLVKAALGYKWFDRLFTRYPACFVRERICFETVNGPMPKAKQANAFFLIERDPLYGHHLFGFRREFSQFGRVIVPD